MTLLQIYHLLYNYFRSEAHLYRVQTGQILAPFLLSISIELRDFIYKSVNFVPNICEFSNGEYEGTKHFYHFYYFPWENFALGKVPLGNVSLGKIRLGKQHPWEKSPLGKITLGKRTLGKNLPWETHTWDRCHWEQSLGKRPLGKIRPPYCYLKRT